MNDQAKVDLEVFILIVDRDLPDTDYKTLIKLVSEEKQIRIGKFHFYRDAQNALLSDILARHEICKRTGLMNRQLLFSANEYGKPYLVNDPHIHFNLSHSGKYIACAIDSKPVGIDIEQIKPIDMKIAERFFSMDEILFIAAHVNEMRTNAFYNIWTRKESYIKLDGKGLSIPLSGFSVLKHSIEGIRYHSMIEKNHDAVCHVCTAQMIKPPCYDFNLSEFLDLLCWN